MKNILLLFVTLSVTTNLKAQCGSSDLTPPNAVCQNITIYLDGAGNANMVAPDIDGGSTDNCPGISFNAAQTSFTCANVGGNAVTLTVTDGNGNTDFCNATVTVADTTSPYISVCPGNQTETPSVPCNFTLPNYTGLVSASDNCGVVSKTQSPAAGNVITGTTAIIITVHDYNGNTSSCTFDVILNDVTPPTAVCQNNSVYLDATGNISITETEIDGGSDDNCSGFTLSVSQTTFTCADLGTNNVTLTITDGAGNSDNCMAVVTVIDTISPIINFPSDITSCAGETVIYTAPTANDNCSTTTTQTDTSGLNSGMIFPAGTTTLEYTSTDGSGNATVGSFNVIVTAVDTSVSVSASTLTANQTGAVYQWIDCNGMMQISGATNQSYAATANGDYAVVIMLNGCSDTSACYTISGVGIVENEFGSAFQLYPNPNGGNFSVDLGEVHELVDITVSDLKGRLIAQNTYSKCQLLNMTITEPEGTYLLTIESAGRKAVIRIVKE